MTIAAVVFDLGGVVMDSPLHAIARYERDHELPAGAVNRVVVESGEAGVPRPLGVTPSRAAFLDDIGRNLKTARALGMSTIKVDDPDVALRELGTLLGMDLG